MLNDLFGEGNLVEQGVEVIAYGSGPGSFTGLRIAASAVQGLAYSCQLPVVAVPTLTVMAQSALRQGAVHKQDSVLCALDARINEIYSALYRYQDGLAVLVEGPFACAPDELVIEQAHSLQAVGNGCEFIGQFAPSLRDRISATTIDVLPAARDLIPLALDRFRCGDIQSPRNVQPVYIRDEISWKKLEEQGRSQ
jgi:tRNA threonylcarbamoyladenosine biosynthesis protein TsaB